jgi:hypothetical protein
VIDFPALTGPHVVVRRCLFPGSIPNCSVRFETARFEPCSPVGPILITFPPEENEYENYGWEVQNVFPPEVAFISALSIAWPPDYGQLCFYPARYPLKLQLPKGMLLQNVDVTFWINSYLNSVPYNRVQTALSGTKFADSTSWDFARTEFTEAEFKDYAKLLHEKFDHENIILLRGLYHMIKARMLMGHIEFMDSAALELYVAMAATFELFLEELRTAGYRNPSNSDVVKRFQELYKVELPGNQYFGDYYTDRIRCLHPVARGEAAVSPPLMVDDVFHLYPDLLRVFEYFVSGLPDEYMARYKYFWDDKSVRARETLLRYMTLVPNATYRGPV